MSQEQWSAEWKCRSEQRHMRMPRREWQARIAVGSLLLWLLPLAACSASNSAGQRPTTAATATVATGAMSPPPYALVDAHTTLGTALPAFADWRVAYLGHDHKLHAVSLDGASDTVGSAMTVAGDPNTILWTAGTASDGKELAYYSGATTQLTVTNVSTGKTTTFGARGIGDSPMLWSPDHQRIAFDSAGQVVCVNPGAKTILASPSAVQVQPYGWLDATHMLVEYVPASSISQASFQSLDVTTGNVRTIARVPVDHAGSFSVAPDGSVTLFSNSPFQADAFTPEADLINNATGAVTPLSALTHLLATTHAFTQVLWRPGSMQAVVATGFPQTATLKYYLADIGLDTVQPLSLAGVAEAWSPDGTTLILATGSENDRASGIGWGGVGNTSADPFTLSAVIVTRQGAVQGTTVLTTYAEKIPLLGFVRTA